MMAVTANLVKSLYRSLIRYADKLEFTDKRSYLTRVKREVRENKRLTDPIDIEVEQVQIPLILYITEKSSSTLINLLPIVLLIKISHQIISLIYSINHLDSDQPES